MMSLWQIFSGLAGIQQSWGRGWSGFLDFFTLSGFLEWGVAMLYWWLWALEFVFPAEVTGYLDGAIAFFAPPGAASSGYDGLGYITIRLAAYFIDFVVPWVLVDVTLGSLMRLFFLAMTVRCCLWIYVKVWGEV